MSHRPRPGLTLAVAATLAGTAPVSTPAAADEPLVERCYTVALTDEEVAAGAVSEIDCYEVPADEPPMALRGGVTYAIAYDTDPSGPVSMWISSPSGVTTCAGYNVAFGAGHFWDNRISSIDLVACGAAKHWQWSNFTGSNQLVMGAGLHSITGTMNNNTSALQLV
jgi:hypothetical protein